MSWRHWQGLPTVLGKVRAVGVLRSSPPPRLSFACPLADPGEGLAVASAHVTCR